MKRWAFVTIILYVLLLAAVVTPGVVAFDGLVALTGPNSKSMLPSEYLDFLLSTWFAWPTWVTAGVFIAAQAALLVIPVKVEKGRPVKRRHVLVTIITAAFLTALLVASAALIIILAIFGENIPEAVNWGVLALMAIMWAFWFFVFRWLCLVTDDPKEWTRKIAFYLYFGSILELMIAVSAHIIVRRRGDCCAPIVTMWGTAAGIAIAIMSFGPGVFYLFAARKRRITPGGQPTPPRT